MVKRSIRFALIFFIVFTISDYFSGEGINWGENTLHAFFLFLGMLFVLWTEIPYKWNKNKEKH